MIDAQHFRDVLGCFPTGICVISSISDSGERLGMVVGSFTSISLDPLLVGFFPDKKSTSWPRIAATGRFCVNLLSSDQLSDCQRFASPAHDKFDGFAHALSPAGLPLLHDILGWVECTIDRVIEIGDHLLVVGIVDALEKRDDGTPLIFFRKSYHQLMAHDRLK